MFALALAAALSHAPSDNLARVESAIRLFQTSRATIESKVGKSQALDIASRLLRDEEYLQQPAPQAYVADWNDALNADVALDVQSVVDLAAGKRRAIEPGVTGLYETFVTSSVDGIWIPVAVYVPRSAKPGGPLALMLHGNTQPETNFLGQPYFRRLADRTGTVLVAPWARGTYDYQGVAENDVYDALHAAQQVFGTNPKRTYLVGYSMGGFSLFKLGPAYRQWTAVMDVSGALMDASASNIAFAWRDTPVYVVTGKRDTVVPAAYPEQTATVLAAMGVPTSFYEQPAGDHALRTLYPALTSAWLDMHAGVVHSGSVPKPTAMGLPKMARIGSDAMKP
jgi:S-formylglutathione hydrolase FrmB